MMEIFRIIALIIGLLSLYMTHLYLKRKIFNKAEFALWGSTWLGLVVISIVPQLVYSGLSLFKVDIVNFIYVLSFLFLYLVCFRMYVRTKELSEKVESLIRQLALKDAGL